MTATNGASHARAEALKRLLAATLAATLLLVIVGGIVRVSSSGLGCGPAGSGLHGWPLCEGRVLPKSDPNQIVEYTHRALAGIVGLLILFTLIQVWRHFRAFSPLKWAAFSLFLLVLFQGALGGLTVENNLEELLVALHLGVAMILIGLLVYALRTVIDLSYREDPLGPVPRPRRFPLLAWTTTAVLLSTIVAGGYMAGTQKYGTVAYETGDGAHLACGKEFPTCNGDILPFGQSRLVDIHMTHRVFVYLATLLILLLLVTSWRTGGRPVRRLVAAGGGLLVAQFTLGALNVWLGEHPGLIVGHLALATALWTVVLALTLSLTRRSPDSS